MHQLSVEARFDEGSLEGDVLDLVIDLLVNALVGGSDDDAVCLEVDLGGKASVADEVGDPALRTRLVHIELVG